jgi:leucyl-tRNA synthetase
MHLLLRAVTHDYERLQYNTVVSGAMKMLNAIDDAKLGDGSNSASGDHAALQEAFGILLRTLYPAAPHIAHGLWVDLGYDVVLGDIIHAPWPEVDEAALAQDEIELVLQVSGKLRGSIRVPAGADRAAIEAAALASPEFLRFAEGKPAKKVVVVPGRLVNVVV